LKSILIVEDNQDLIELIVDLLSDENYEIVSAQNGRDAYEILISRRFDLLICDLHIPGMPANQLLQTAKNESLLPHKVIIISGDIENSEVPADVLSQFICLEKPIFIRNFKAVLTDVMEAC